MIKRKMAFILFLNIAAMAQQYYEASGSTQIFTLKAGANAKPAAVLNENKLVRKAAPHLLVTVHNGVFLRIQGTTTKATVSIYNVVGKRISNIAIDGQAPVALSKDLPIGVYFARLTINSRVVQTVRFWMVR
jgi:hypothetical protein